MRVLLIDDDEDLRAATKAVLRHAGFAVDEAPDGDAGIQLGLANEYDAIVSDLVMPNMDGKGVCAALRKAGRQTPILLLSVENTPQTKTDLLNIGADDYLSKPYDGAELVARIRAICRRPPQTIPAGTLSHDGLDLDPVNRTLRTKGRRIDLRPREFNLLEYFFRHPDIVLTRTQILENVWDINADPFSNTIEVHIASLRKKIGYGRIKTISSVGYRFQSKQK